jgi:hypothetical protein
MYDLTELLNNPEDYYPGNFDTPQRANALLTGLCQDAAKEIERLARANAALVVALEDLMEATGEPPDRNCSCHISPPCPDCIDYSGWREALENANSALALAKATEDQAGPTTGRTSCNTPVFQNLPLNTPEASALKQAMLTDKATGETK